MINNATLLVAGYPPISRAISAPGFSSPPWDDTGDGPASTAPSSVNPNPKVALGFTVA